MDPQIVIIAATAAGAALASVVSTIIALVIEERKKQEKTKSRQSKSELMRELSPLSQSNENLLRELVKLGKSAVDIARNNNDKKGELEALINLGNSYQKASDYERAAACYKQAWGLSKKLGDLQNKAKIDWSYAILLIRQGKSLKALPYLKSSVAITEQLGLSEAVDQSTIVNNFRAELERQSRT